MATRIVNLLGADIPSSLLAPNASNEHGFWESPSVIGLHERLLTGLGRSWNDPRPLPDGWQTGRHAEQAREQIAAFLTTEFLSNPLYVIKDPRLCRFAGLWGEVLGELGHDCVALLPVRHPGESAESLERVHGLPRRRGLALWSRYVLEAEMATRSMERCYCDYSALLADWRAEATRIGDQLGLDTLGEPDEMAAAQIEDFIRPAQRHLDNDSSGGLAGSPIEVRALAIYAAAKRACVSGGDSSASRSDLDALAALVKLDDEALGLELPVFSQDAIFGAQYQVSAQNGTPNSVGSGLIEAKPNPSSLDLAVGSLCDQVNSLTDETSTVRAEMASKQRQIDEMGEHLRRTSSERDAALAENERVAKEHDQARETHAKVCDQRDRLERRAEKLRRQRDKAKQSRDQKRIETDTRLQTLRSEHETAIERLAETNRQLHLVGLKVTALTSSPSLRGGAATFAAASILRDARSSLKGAGRFIGSVATGKIFREIQQRSLAETIRAFGWFDEGYYLSENPDVAAMNIDPLVHYLRHGAGEGRNPSPAFNTRDYLVANPDIAGGSMNPLAHYLLHGAAEGRPLTPATQAPAAETHSAELIAQLPFYSGLRFAKRFRFAELTPPEGSADPDCLDIHWVLPPFEGGAGGCMNIFRMISHLESFGHRCTIWINPISGHPCSAHKLKKLIDSDFTPLRAKVEYLPDDLSTISGDAIIATDRWTAYPVRTIANVRRRFYFLQDHEPEFYPAGSEFLLSQNTYSFGFDCLSNGEWLHRMAKERYGLWSMKWEQAADESVYYTDDSIERKNARIAFYARYQTPRRAVELGMLAFEVLAERGVEFGVDFFGSPLGMGSMPVGYSYHDHGVMSAAKLGDLYRRCTLGLVFSATNYSISPREMMNCGLPVVELDGPSSRLSFPSDCTELVPPDPVEIADRLEKLLENEGKRRAMGEAAVRFASSFDWEASARIVEAALLQRTARRCPQPPIVGANR